MDEAQPQRWWTAAPTPSRPARIKAVVSSSCTASTVAQALCVSDRETKKPRNSRCGAAVVQRLLNAAFDRDLLNFNSPVGLQALDQCCAIFVLAFHNGIRDALADR